MIKDSSSSGQINAPRRHVGKASPARTLKDEVSSEVRVIINFILQNSNLRIAGASAGTSRTLPFNRTAKLFDPGRLASAEGPCHDGGGAGEGGGDVGGTFRAILCLLDRAGTNKLKASENFGTICTERGTVRTGLGGGRILIRWRIELVFRLCCISRYNWPRNSGCRASAQER